MPSKTGGFTLEENAERLKLILPIQRNWYLFVLFTICMLVWVSMLIAIAEAMIQERYGLVLNVMLLVWIFVWLWFGRILWGRWQYYAAGREILFINIEQLVVRRPVSILGTTEAYDMRHVTPVYYSDKHQCPAFDYAYQHVYFGRSLSRDEANDLIELLNNRFFNDGS